MGDKLKQLKGGELIVGGLLGDNEQIQVVVDEFGNRLASALNDATGRLELRPLSELIDTKAGKIQFFDPKAIKQVWGSDEMLGASLFSGWADSIIFIERDGEKYEAVIKFDVIRHAEDNIEPISVEIHKSTLEITTRHSSSGVRF